MTNIIGILENQMERTLDHGMETGLYMCGLIAPYLLGSTV